MMRNQSLLSSLHSIPHSHHPSTIISLSFSHPRRRRRPTRHSPTKPHPSVPTHLHFVLDVENLKQTPPVSFLQRTLTFFDSNLHHFLSQATDAYMDLHTLVTIQPGTSRVVVSCSDSTVRFVGAVVVWSFVVVVAVVGVLGRLGRGRGRGGGKVEVVTRRDRSLGGREVVVAVREERDRGDLERLVRESKGLGKNVGKKKERRLPSWWPVALPRPVVEQLNALEDYRREANRLVQAIMDAKLSGKDVSEDDILELRRICRTSGVRLSIGTENARDSLYRSSVHYAINTCCMTGGSLAQIDGEDARVFVAGLAHDLGVSAPHAATIVTAAVAARTRLWFLQAWALEMQSKHAEATEELKKICFSHQIFPPEPSSPEMEMVARGLQKHLKQEDREFLLKKLIDVCGEESRRSAAEALGL